MEAAFRSEFGFKLISKNINRVNHSERWYESRYFNENIIQMQMDYCTDIAILSKCDALVASSSQGTIMAYLLNGGRYKHVSFIQKGEY